MSDINKVITVVNYPVVNANSVKFVRGFELTVNGGVKPLFTNRPENAQKFGPEGQIHVNWLNRESTATSMYALYEASTIPQVLFDDGKDYSTVDIALLINSSYETSMLYNAFKDKDWTYKQDNSGNLITVGVVEGQPVCIAPMIHTVQGLRVLYVEPTSQVISYPMITEWVNAKINNPTVELLSSPDRLIYRIEQMLNEKEKN